MVGFCELIRRDGTSLFVRPDMVKAVFALTHGTWTGSNVVIDGHDFEVEGTPMDVMHHVQFDCHCVEDPHPGER